MGNKSAMDVMEKRITAIEKAGNDLRYSIIQNFEDRVMKPFKDSIEEVVKRIMVNIKETEKEIALNKAIMLQNKENIHVIRAEKKMAVLMIVLATGAVGSISGALGVIVTLIVMLK